jgi:hypothetical protein
MEARLRARVLSCPLKTPAGAPFKKFAVLLNEVMHFEDRST